jgi:hypothetical protein
MPDLQVHVRPALGRGGLRLAVRILSIFSGPSATGPPIPAAILPGGAGLMPERRSFRDRHNNTIALPGITTLAFARTVK